MTDTSYQHNASNILQMCAQILKKQKTYKNQYNNQDTNIQKNDQIKQILFSALNSLNSPHEQSQNNKIIQKLRRKNNKKKQQKQNVIRKTDLGQNQLIFTKQQLQRLKQIDKQQMNGKGYQNNYHQNYGGLLQKSTQTQHDPNNNKKYFINSNIDNSRQQIINYLDWVDPSELKNSKQKKKSKILNFQKRQGYNLSNSLISINKKPKSPLPLLMPKHSNPFNGLKTLSLSKAKSCYPLMKKNSVDKGFLNSLNSNDIKQQRRISDKEKLNEIINKVDQKIQKQYSSHGNSKKYIYMTQQRKQALFQCEILRRVKRQIGTKFYHNLQLTYDNKQRQSNNQQNLQYDKQNNSLFNLSKKSNLLDNQSFKKSSILNKQKNFTNQKQKVIFESQADKMIHKNRNRLKQQRKRVIQKIIC